MAKVHGFIQEFKKFLSRGNVMDLAVGIIIGTAFTAIVKSLVNDIIMPLIGAIVGGVNFSHLRIIIRKATVERPELALTYGNFLQNVIDFLIIAIVVFMIVRTFNSFREKLEKAKKQEEAAAAAATPVPEPVVPADIVLLTEIRDLLQKKKSV